MVVVLIVWIALALVLGALIGRAIHRADVIQFPSRPEHAPWAATSPVADPVAAGEPAPAPGAGRDAALAA